MTGGTILVTGGAGYIGSHAVLALRDAGLDVVVLDDLSTGRREAVPSGVPLVEGSVGDTRQVASLIDRHRVTDVLHFAGSIVVPDSVRQPLDYYHNNLANSLALIRTSAAAGIRRFIFSSTAAVYGIPSELPVPETAPTEPINPYGASKLMVERILADAALAGDLRYVALRYFNVAGADPGGRAGQCGPVATHLIKIACEAVVGRRDGVSVYGADYPTPDGTCIRDYIHVSDLAEAHRMALVHLRNGGDSLVLNCGYGRGFSVLEVLAAVRRVSGHPLPVTLAGRRAGDPPELVAGAGAIRRCLGWTPCHDDLDGIVASALAWERHLKAHAL